MINNNLKNFISFFVGGTNTEVHNTGMVNTSGIEQTGYLKRYGLNTPAENSATDGVRIVIGSGSTSPTTTDFKLVSQVDSLTYLGSSTSIAKKDNNIAVISTTYVNNTSESVCVSEIGLLMRSYNQDFLLAREVITPVSIGVGETYTFTMTIG